MYIYMDVYIGTARLKDFDGIVWLQDEAQKMCTKVILQLREGNGTPAWRIPGTEEPSGLLSMGLQSRTRLKRLSSSTNTTATLKGGVSQVAQWQRIPLLMQEPQETWVQSLLWEDPLEVEMTTHSIIHIRIIQWTEQPAGLQSEGLQRVRHDWVTEHALVRDPPKHSLSIQNSGRTRMIMKFK